MALVVNTMFKNWRCEMQKLAVLALLAVAQCAIAADAKMALPGRLCRVDPDGLWSEVEQWVWKERVCVGRIADLNSRYGRTLDPTIEDGWDDERILSTEFLESILFHEPWKSALPRQGVRIVGAFFPASVKLNGGHIEHELLLDDSRFTGTVDLFQIQTQSLVSLWGSVFLRELNMRSANIGGQLNMGGAKFSGNLKMGTIAIAGSLYMRNGAEFADVDLIGAKSAQLDMSGAKVSGELDIQHTNIGGSFFMRDAEFTQPIVGVFLQIGGNVDTRGATLSDLDLSGAQIEGELRLATPYDEPTWLPETSLVLRNTTVGAIVDTKDAWPRNIDLDGFRYQRLGGFAGAADVSSRGSQWYVDWLARDEPYTPQPYEQLATVLQRMGHGDEANDILYAGQERARGLAWATSQYGSWFGLSALKVTIGYGYGGGYFLSLIWILVLVLVGRWFLIDSDQQNQGGTPPLKIGFLYSLDRLLPIIQFDRRHYDDVNLIGFTRYYFYIHQIMGYALASFLIAGLSGLTK